MSKKKIESNNMSKTKSASKNKPKKKRSTAIVVLIVAVIAVLYFVFSNRNSSDESISNNANYSSIYKFQKNGELTFTSKKGDFLAKIDIEIAETEEKQTQGLMYRNKMKENRGMLFIFDKDDYRYFWMKNTVIPLDMVFVNSNFKIVTIRKNARPYDLSSYASTAPAKYVVEVNAGFCDKYGIKVGDKISFRVF
jgi:uncharacterized membrane protein (UPF0127 family)